MVMYVPQICAVRQVTLTLEAKCFVNARSPPFPPPVSRSPLARGYYLPGN